MPLFTSKILLRCSAVLFILIALYLLWMPGSLILNGPVEGSWSVFYPQNQTKAPSAPLCACPPTLAPNTSITEEVTPENVAPADWWRIGTGITVKNLFENDIIDYPKPGVRYVMVDHCLKKLNLPPGESGYQQYNTTKLHVVFGVWLPSGWTHSHAIIEPILYEIYTTGLLTRPNTYYHFVVSTNSSAELNWFKSLILWRHVPNFEMIPNFLNMYEFPAMRTMWELACRDPDAIYLYLHNKGTRYRYQGRHTQELVLTRQIIHPWKSMLTLLMSLPEVPHIGLGGLGFQWMNFFWVRGSYLRESPKPVRSADRYYYEHYLSRRVTNNTNQCHLAKGLASAFAENLVPTPKETKIQSSFSIDTCSMGSITASVVLRTVFDDQARLPKLIEQYPRVVVLP